MRNLLFFVFLQLVMTFISFLSYFHLFLLFVFIFCCEHLLRKKEKKKKKIKVNEERKWTKRNYCLVTILYLSDVKNPASFSKVLTISCLSTTTPFEQYNIIATFNERWGQPRNRVLFLFGKYSLLKNLLISWYHSQPIPISLETFQDIQILRAYEARLHFFIPSLFRGFQNIRLF